MQADSAIRLGDRSNSHRNRKSDRKRRNNIIILNEKPVDYSQIGCYVNGSRHDDDDDAVDSGIACVGKVDQQDSVSDRGSSSRGGIIGCNSSSSSSGLSEGGSEDLRGVGLEEVMLLPVTAARDVEGEAGEPLDEYDRAERWLDTHPEFLLDYITRKQLLPRLMGESPLTSPVSQPGFDPVAITAGSNSASKTSSGANTPVRKISAQEFERNGQLLARMVQTVDGIPSFLSAPSEYSTVIGAAASSAPKPRRSLSELKALDEHELMHELIRDICNDLDVTRLCHKILKNVSFLLGADRCSLFLVKQNNQSETCNSGQGSCVSGSGEGHSSEQHIIKCRRKSSTGDNPRDWLSADCQNTEQDITSGCGNGCGQTVNQMTDRTDCDCLVNGSGHCDRYLVSTLFDVGVASSIEEGTKMSHEIRIPMGTGIVGHVAMTGQGLNIPDAYQDKRFNKEVDKLTGYKTRSILCMPVLDTRGQVIAVAQAINKVSVKDEPFTEQDEKVFKSYLGFCGIGIHNAQMYERSTLENRRNQLMLDLAWVIFEEQSNVETLINKILLHTLSLLRCERCQLLLVDESDSSKFSQAFDIQASDFDNDNSYYREGSHKARFPINRSIVGYVASTGQILNIRNAYQDIRFDPSVERDSDFRSRTILCIPIKNSQSQVIGVIQLTNKLDDTAFNKNDENLFEAFAIFCGMGINNTRMYEQVVKAMAKQRVAVEVLSYHSTATTEEVQRLKKCVMTSPVVRINLTDYKFNDTLLDDDGTLKAVCRMFQDLNLIDKFSIPQEVFLRWLLTVKKNYRAVAYHNWRHAFNVMQTMYTMTLSDCMKNVLNDLETFALMVGCLSHDLDHRGTNNQFQIKTMSALAELYSTSIMEWHHYEHCIRILTTKGTEILCNMSEEQNKQMTNLLREAILATDLSLYFQHREDFFRVVNTNSHSWSHSCNRPLLRSMMMTACDLGAITKPWHIQQKVAYLLADEFFEQGDIEKSELHMKPIDMMDRDNKSRLPSMQLVFIDTICMPIYEAFARVSDDYRTMLIGCRQNREKWAELAEGRKLEYEVKERENENKDDDDDADDDDCNDNNDVDDNVKLCFNQQNNIVHSTAV